MRNQTEERRRLERWRRPGRLDGRLAELLATAEAKAERAADAYAARLKIILPPDDLRRLLNAWSAGQEAPADLWPILEADEQAMAFYREFHHIGWALDAVKRSAIMSEHYWFQELGTVKPPRSWGFK